MESFCELVTVSMLSLPFPLSTTSAALTGFLQNLFRPPPDSLNVPMWPLAALCDNELDHGAQRSRTGTGYAQRMVQASMRYYMSLLAMLDAAARALPPPFTSTHPLPSLRRFNGGLRDPPAGGNTRAHRSTLCFVGSARATPSRSISSGCSQGTLQGVQGHCVVATTGMR